MVSPALAFACMMLVSPRAVHFVRGGFKKQAKDSQVFLSGCKTYVSDVQWDLGPMDRWEFLFMYSGLDCSAILFRPGDCWTPRPQLPDPGSPCGLDRSSVFYNMTTAEVHPPRAMKEPPSPGLGFPAIGLVAASS